MWLVQPKLFSRHLLVHGLLFSNLPDIWLHFFDFFLCNYNYFGAGNPFEYSYSKSEMIPSGTEDHFAFSFSSTKRYKPQVYCIFSCQQKQRHCSQELLKFQSQFLEFQLLSFHPGFVLNLFIITFRILFFLENAILFLVLLLYPFSNISHKDVNSDIASFSFISLIPTLLPSNSFMLNLEIFNKNVISSFSQLN